MGTLPFGLHASDADVIVEPVDYRRMRGMRTAVGAMTELDEMMRGGCAVWERKRGL